MAAPTTNQFGALFAINAVTSAYTAFEAGKMRKIAYEHEAAVAEINAKQQEIEATFFIVDKQNELISNLAAQNVIAAATGRQPGAGSVEALTQTSISNLAKDTRRVEVTGESRKVAALMSSSFARSQGEVAEKFGLLSGVSSLTSGAVEASRFIK